MSRKILLNCQLIVSLAVGIVTQQCVWAQPPESPPAASVPDVPELADIPEPEVLEKGPIHEAFAEPVALDRQKPIAVKKEPPQPINEMPPDERPEGRNVQWVKGYWAFNEDVDDFVWVSGLWRDVPPGREWIPGQWQKTNEDYTWTSGYWAASDVQTVEHLPDPPESLEQGPSSPAPGDNYLWTPGSWRFEDGEYYWQPGFWYEAQQDWVWVPNHYCSTPQGSVYVNGYWDYPLARRGLLYAPIYWSGGYGGWYGAGYGYFRPLSIINTGLLIANLFVHRDYGGYYYGYGYGLRPPWLYGWGPHGYNRWGFHGGGHHKNFDPIWAHHNWHDRNGRHNKHRGNWAGDDHVRGSGQGRDADRRSMVTSVDKLSRQQRDALKLRQLSSDQVAQYKRKADQGRNATRTDVGSRKTSEGRIARDTSRRAWTDAGDRHAAVSGKGHGSPNTANKQTGSHAAGRVQSSDSRARDIASGTQSGSGRAGVSTRGSGNERSVLANRGATVGRVPAQSGISQQSVRQPRQRSTSQQSIPGNFNRQSSPTRSVRSIPSGTQHNVMRSPSRSSMQHFSRPSPSRSSSSVQRSGRSSSNFQSSGRSFQSSRGSFSSRGGGGHGRGGGGGRGHGGGGGGRGGGRGR